MLICSCLCLFLAELCRSAVAVRKPTLLMNGRSRCDLVQTVTLCLQCFDAVGWAAGRASGLVACWHGYLSGARCRLAYGPADATATHCLLLQ